ncbi:MAG: DUF2865 domain-containing protein [Alphaproteobacteria bacterium]|nr:MAG: DUF2865 domain-containing protein [Alphaproteobacteria bacterium]
MIGTTIAIALRGLGGALPALVLCAAPALAQFSFPFSAPTPPSAVPSPAPNTSSAAGMAGRNQACLRLESQLAAIDRGAGIDPARAEQIKRYEETVAKQQAELDRLGQQSQRLGCQGGGFFALFSGQSPQCGPLNNQMQQMRANLDRSLSDIQRLQGNSGEREAQRRGILVALGQNDCGPQYRQYATAGPGGFFDNLFGGVAPAPNAPLAGTYRTLCVRTCDGYYFPISYSTVPAKFAEDEQLCRRLCPAAEVTLYSHRNPGEDVARAVSISGRLYTELPAAFSYRKQLNPACNCRLPGQSWAEALRQTSDQTIERGDIVVTEERAKQLSQPRFDPQGKPVNSSQTSARAKGADGVNNAPLPPAAAEQQPTAPAEEKIEQEPGKRKVRAVGPTFYPVR